MLKKSTIPAKNFLPSAQLLPRKSLCIVTPPLTVLVQAPTAWKLLEDASLFARAARADQQAAPVAV